MKIYIIKSRNFGSEVVDNICAYDNLEAATQHIKSYQEIYKNDLKSELFFETLFMEKEFKSK